MTSQFIRKPGWCNTHQDFAWIYDDGSEQCWFDLVVEETNEHDIAPMVRTWGVDWRWSYGWRHKRPALDQGADS